MFDRKIAIDRAKKTLDLAGLLIEGDPTVVVSVIEGRRYDKTAGLCMGVASVIGLYYDGIDPFQDLEERSQPHVLQAINSQPLGEDELRAFAASAKERTPGSLIVLSVKDSGLSLERTIAVLESIPGVIAG